jgi:2-dehydropantoate 2-reductase
MKHAILGAGAIGGLVGTALASLGEDVTVIVRPEKLAAYPANLTLERPSGSLTAPAKATASLKQRVDVLWIATKTYQLQSALEEIEVSPADSPAHVIPLLNGIDHIAPLRARFGDASVIPATIAVEAEAVAPGRFIQRSPVVRLNFAASGKPLLRTIVEQLGNLAFTCQFIDNEQTLLWTKLCFLAPFALTTSASGMNIGEILANPAWKQKLTAAVGEACAVANASGADIDASQIRAALDSAPPGMRSSMQKDLAAGRKLELDAIGGPILRGGERHGIEVSATRNLIAAINSNTGAR